MNPDHRRFWIEKNDWLPGSAEEVEAILEQLFRVFPAGGIVQGTETSLKRLWPLLAKLWKREQIVLMGKLPGWFQGMDMSKPEAFLDPARWVSFGQYETAYEIPPGPFGIDAESWTSMFLNAGADAHHIQSMARRFRGYAGERDWPTYCYQPSLWNDDPRRVQLCMGIFGRPHSELLWHDGRHADPSPNEHAIRMADQSDMLSRVLRFTKVNCGENPISQYSPEMLDLASWRMMHKPVYCYTSSVASTKLFLDAMEVYEKGNP